GRDPAVLGRGVSAPSRRRPSLAVPSAPSTLERRCTPGWFDWIPVRLQSGPRRHPARLTGLRLGAQDKLDVTFGVELNRPGKVNLLEGHRILAAVSRNVVQPIAFHPVVGDAIHPAGLEEKQRDRARGRLFATGARRFGFLRWHRYFARGYRLNGLGDYRH